MAKPAKRTVKIEPFHVMRILEESKRLERAGYDIVHMEVGEPDFATPQPIVAAGIRALERNQTHYTPALGLPELRDAIASYYRQNLNVEVDARRIAVTPGASGALQLLLALLAEQGSSVLLSDPGYPCNRNLVSLFDATPVAISVDAASNFQLTPEAVASAWRSDTRAVIVTTPSNPTGSLLPIRQIEAIAHVVNARGGSLIVDEIYQGLVYGQRSRSALSIGTDLYVINSFSKFFGMTGWRLGWLVAPEESIPVLDKLAQNLYLAASTPAQHAALAAFSAETLEILESRRSAFKARRDYLSGALDALGFTIDYRPEGAFYLYADCSSFGLDSATLSQRLLEEARVAVTPGLDFGEYRSDSYIRFAYTANLDRLKEGVRRMKGLIDSL